VVHVNTNHFVVSNIDLFNVLGVFEDFPTVSLRSDSINSSSLDDSSVKLDTPDASLVTNGYVLEITSNVGPLSSISVSFMDTFSEVDKVIGGTDTPNVVSETALKVLHGSVILGLPTTVLIILSRPSLLE
jgi:hypothetical protein